MATPPYLPVYRLTVYQPRSYPGNTNETIVMTPAAGAPHSDQFIVSTIQGLAGAKPYLDLPTGKQGAIDVLSKKATIGTLTLRLCDFPLNATQPPAQVWFTAFIGDANGKNRMKGCKAVLEESLDGAVTFNAIFTARIGDVFLSTRLWVSLELRSIADDMQKAIFIGRPHQSISYAFRPALFPIGLPQNWGFGTTLSPAFASALPVNTSGISGSVIGKNGPTGGGINYGLIQVDPTTQNEALAMATQQSWPFAIGAQYALLVLKIISGTVNGVNKAGTTAAYRIVQNNIRSTSAGALPFTLNGNQHAYVSWFGNFWPLDPADPLYLDVPDVGATVQFYVTTDAPVTSDLPLFIDDVHPIQFWADILDGKFSVLNSDFSARPMCARDTTTFNNLISDPSFGFWRGKLEDQAQANDWIEKYICQHCNVAYRLDGQGRVVPADLRFSSAVSVTGSITDTDLGTTAVPQWKTDGSKAVFAVNVQYYVDTPAAIQDIQHSADRLPDFPLSMVTSSPNNLLVINPAAELRDAGDQILDLDAIGVRLAPSEYQNGGATLTSFDKIAKLQARLLDLLPPFAGGAALLPIRLARGSAAAATCYPGTYWSVTITAQPDPVSLQRGGTRLMLCTSRTENRLYVDVEFLDVGANASALIPAIGTLAITAAGLDVPITLNGAGEPVRVEYNITPAGTGARPAANDAGWTLLPASVTAPLVATSSTAHLDNIPANVRIWVRARTQTSGKTLKQPSAWVFPSGGSPAGSIDNGAIASPTIGTPTGVTGNRATVPWTNGDATKNVEVYINAGGIPGGGWTPAMQVQPTLPAGSTTVPLRNLTPSQTYGVAVRHRDASGGTSAFSATTFATTAAPSTAPLTPPLGIGGGGGTSGVGLNAAPIVAQAKIPVAVGISLLLNPADPSYDFEIQRAPDVSGAPGTWATINAQVPGATKVFHDSLPLDGAKRWYRTRHVGFGDTPGPYNDPVSATPIIQPARGPTDSISNQLNAQGRYRCKVHNSSFYTIATGTSTALTFDTEDYNIGAIHSTSSHPSRITIPAGGGGVPWSFEGVVDWSNNSDTTQRRISLWKNGAKLIDGGQIAAVNGNDTFMSLAWSDVPADGDYFELVVWHNAAGSVIVGGTTYFSAFAVW